MSNSDIEYVVAFDTAQALKAEKAMTRSVDNMEDALEDLDKTNAKTQESMKNKTEKAQEGIRTQTKKTTKMFKLQKGAMQQAGFQVQDFAVQVAGGQSAIVAFGQQGSQLAGVLGPGGAVIGAIIAISAALGTAFLPALMGSSKATEELVEKLQELVDTSKLTAPQARVLINNEKESIKEKKKKIQAITEEIAANRKLLSQMVSSGTGINEGAFSVPLSAEQNQKRYAEMIDITNKELDVQRANLALLNDELATSNQKIKTYSEFLEAGVTPATKEQSETVKNLVEQVTQQAETYGKTARGMALYIAEQNKASQADKAAINIAFDKIEALEAQKKAQDDLIADEAARTMELERLKLQAKTLGVEKTLQINQQLNEQLITLDRLKNEGLLANEMEYQERKALLIEEAALKQIALAESTAVKVAEVEKQASLVDWEGFGNRAAGAMASVAIGAQTGEEAVKSLATSLITEMIGALIKMGAQYLINAAIGTSTMASTTAAAVASGATITAAMTPAAIAASIATFGGAAVAGGSAVVGAAVSGASAIAATSLAGGRLYGGPVAPGNIYPVTENGRSELLQENGKQYLIPGSNGKVISNNNMSEESGGVNNFNINLTTSVRTREEIRRELQLAGQDVVSVVRDYQNNRGEKF